MLSKFFISLFNYGLANYKIKCIFNKNKASSFYNLYNVIYIKLKLMNVLFSFLQIKHKSKFNFYFNYLLSEILFTSDSYFN